MSEMHYWSTILDIIDYGIEGDKEKCREYAELLIMRLEQTGEIQAATRIRRVLDRKSRGAVIYPAEKTS